MILNDNRYSVDPRVRMETDVSITKDDVEKHPTDVTSPAGITPRPERVFLATIAPAIRH